METYKSEQFQELHEKDSLCDKVYALETLWENLTVSEKAVYIEKARADYRRYVDDCLGQGIVPDEAADLDAE
jgi:hypothetical protein